MTYFICQALKYLFNFLLPNPKQRPLCRHYCFSSSQHALILAKWHSKAWTISSNIALWYGLDLCCLHPVSRDLVRHITSMCLQRLGNVNFMLVYMGIPVHSGELNLLTDDNADYGWQLVALKDISTLLISINLIHSSSFNNPALYILLLICENSQGLRVLNLQSSKNVSNIIGHSISI